MKQDKNKSYLDADKNMNIVQAKKKITKHPPILVNMSDYRFFANYSSSLCLIFPSFR